MSAPRSWSMAATGARCGWVAGRLEAGGQAGAGFGIDEGGVEAGRGSACQIFVGPAEMPLRHVVFVADRGCEIGRVVAVEGDGAASVAQAVQRVRRIVGIYRRADVAGRADFQHDSFVGDAADEGGVLDGTDTVADSPDGQAVEGVADAFRAGGLSGMDGAGEAGLVVGDGEDFCEGAGRQDVFVAAHAEAGQQWMAVPDAGFRYFQAALDTEMADAGDDQAGFDAEIGAGVLDPLHDTV